MKKKIIVLILVSILLLIITVFLLIFSYTGPADGYLIKNFQSHRTDYETIVSMMQEDNNVYATWRDDNSFYYKDRDGDKLASNRIEEYQTLLKNIDIESAIYYDKYLGVDAPNIKFTHFQRGDLLDGIDKGIVFFLESSALPDNITTDKKTKRFVLPGSDHQATHYIDKSWYIFLDAYNT